ncbi:MAG: G5 domain protein [Candidatus Paraimprobicoccus trichonymphae]|uniref:G5 domain protein n=1 Tax=Candidatus Paraimprobicoccus trichonymphae TaxID=3033793 RepID=A0AA48I9L2_9FIRM|nr:MAG: G5 domain protein [Candidatus Paraimprobicoccus trichonymphae]
MNVFKSRKNLKKIAKVTVTTTVSLAVTLTLAAFSKGIRIEDGDKKITFVTTSNNIENILNQANVTLFDGDFVEVSEKNKISSTLKIKRAFDVKIECDGESKIVKLNSENTVSDAINKSEMIIGENDVLSHNFDTKVKPNMTIFVQKKVEINIKADNREILQFVPTKITVGQALKLAEIPIFEQDIINISLDVEINENAEIVIERVGYENIIRKEEIAFKKIIKKTDDLEEGINKISVKGKNGEKEIFIRETKINGEIKNSEITKKRILVEPVDQVMLVGTKKKPVIDTSKVNIIKKNIETIAKKIVIDKSGYIDMGNGILMDKSGNEIKYSCKLSGQATAYTADEKARTFTGKKPISYSTAAVNFNKIPRGKKLIVFDKSGRVFNLLAEDTGSALIKDEAAVDIFMPTREDCINYGRQEVEIYALK